MGWFSRKPVSLADVLFKTYPVKVHGVKFRIRKLNPIDFASGAKALHMQFDTWKSKGQQELVENVVKNEDKIKEHYRQVIMAAVQEPKLVWKKEEEGMWIDNLFTDWDLVNELYLRIMETSYGKKKLMSHSLLKTDSSI